MTYRNRYILRLTILLSVLLAGGSAMAQESSSSTGSGVVVHGSVYGGGNLADVKTNTEVNICAKKQTSGETVTYVAVSAGNGVTIEGNVYGGGKGVAKMVPGEIGAGDAFECKKAMVGVDNDGVGSDGKPKPGGTTVRIFNGTVGTLEGTAEAQTLKEGTGNVYGGGQVGRVERNTIVTIGAQGSVDSKPIILGDVFGAGRGEKTHGYSALVRGNSDVTIQGCATVGKSVYGGGQIATVGRYTVVDGLPTETTSGGICTVTIRDNAIITENVFGAGKGILPYEDCVTGDKPQHMNGAKHMVNDAWDGTWDDVLVEYPEYDPDDYDQNKPAYANYIKFIKSLALASDTEVTIGGESTVYGSVYGGSESGFVQQNTQVKILGTCEIGTTTTNATIFGGGLGSDDFAEAGIVRGNTEVYVNGGTTNGTVYGGGSLGNVKGTTEVNVYANKVNGAYEVVAKADDAVTITGNVYGGGKGHEDTFTCEKAMVGVDGDGIEHPEGGTTVRIFNGKVNGSVYGGGQVGRVEKNTVVTIGSGNGGNNTSKPYIKGDVFGAGAGVNTHGFSALVRGNSTVTVEGDAQIGESVYGGGQIATVGRYIVINSLPTKPAGGGLCTVHIQGHAIIGQESEGDVFGAGRGVMPYEGVSSGNNPWSMKRNNEGVDYEYTYTDTDEYFTFIQTLGLASDTEVTIGADAEVKGSVYGGSESGFVQRYTQVTIQGSCEIGTTVGTGDNATDQHGDIYGGGRGDNSVEGYEHAGKVKGNTTVNINGGTMHGSVYGGGEKGYTVGRADVNMAGGIVYHDVYGGGALADTNVGNGDNVNGYVEVPGLTAGSSSVVGYYENTYVNTGDDTAVANETYYYGNDHAPVTVLAVGTSLEDLETDLYEKSGDTTTATTDETALENKVYYTQSGVPFIITVGTSTTIGGTKLSEWSESDYVASSGTAVTGKKYYTITHPTTVNLLGGTIKGDAYGGGLGRLGTEVVGVKYTQSEADAYNEANSLNEGDAGYKTTEDWMTQPVAAADGTGSVKATVYGDINVNLGSASGSTATAFYLTNYDSGVVKSGRVFGCNNFNGSPQGNVTVDVFKTVTGKDGSGNNVTRTVADPNNPETPQKGNSVTPSYELDAVYGGGNLANFAPSATGKKAYVIIETCNVSVQSVYGGGNAADVPETDVLVKGAYEIGEVFGGGNGMDSYTTDGGAHWTPNPGADVNGNATTLLKGGYIHEAYGGSNTKGTISGNVSINKSTGGVCTLQVDDLYGAGKNADVEGDLIVILGCSETRTENVYGCSMNANVKGNVELTITSGEYGKVFGGNNLSGSIFGHIIVNIEEIGCSPIIIDELYGCGNDAPYSTYGYWQDGMLSNGKPNYVARTSATDHQDDVVTFDGKPHTVPPYADPEVNIISCTRIGKVFGGGLGEHATVYGNPKVNINMIKGAWAGQTYESVDDEIEDLEVPDQLGAIGGGYTDANGITIGVFGGGNEATVEGNTTINVGTEQYVYVVKTVDVGADVSHYYTFNGDTEIYELTTDDTAKEGTTYYEQKSVQGANIVGNVYGGGNLADVTGNTFVNVCAKKNASDVYEAVEEGSEGVIITGNVFGGGKGQALESGDGAFLCAKAMVGINNAGLTDTSDGGTSVVIGNGKVDGSVYGGGEVGRVEKNTKVTIGIGDGGELTHKPDITGNVFGAGQGKYTHGYSALVRGNTRVTIEGDAWVEKSVYGGGEIASVGRYNVASAAYHTTHPEILEGQPYSLKNNNSGKCYVIVQGRAEIGPNNMKMRHEGVAAESDKPDDTGHVFGAGKGVLPYNDLEGNDIGNSPWRVPPGNFKEEFTETFYSGKTEYAGRDYVVDYLRFIETLALTTGTDVTIGGYAFIKGSVYGGSENGHVQHDTHVTIKENCQIGNGDGVNARYTNWPTDIEDFSTSWAECASWPYGIDTDNDNVKDLFAPYDPYADASGNYPSGSVVATAAGGRHVASDGHTYYGNVFGGGSGSIPYRPGLWHRAAGSVGGNTTVDITGGHILTSVYGGNEQTDVGTYVLDDNDEPTIPSSGGKCTINMTGGTVGVPRTVQDMQDHPVTCNLYGAGKGDPRLFFNTWTNVIETEVNISGSARIYGSTFGGAEDGHVMRNAVTNIGGTKVTINGVEQSVTGTGVIIGTTGTSYFDGNVFGGGRGFTGDAQTAGSVGGNVKVNIENGNILGSLYGGGRLASVGTYFSMAKITDPNDATKKIDNPKYGNFMEDGEVAAVYYTETEANAYNSLLDGAISVDDWKVEPVEASEGVEAVEGEHYSQSEVDAHNADLAGAVSTSTVKTPAGFETFGHVTVNVSGGTIGRDFTSPVPTGAEHSGNVFGGSMGRLDLLNGSRNSIWPKMAQVKTSAVNIYGNAEIKKSVYGGGELGSVRDNASVTIGGYLNPVLTDGSNIKILNPINNASDSTITIQTNNGKPIVGRDVYGGGYGSEDYDTYTIFSVQEPKAGVTNPTSPSHYDTNWYAFTPMQFAGCVGRNTFVHIKGGQVKKNVYGGGEMASVGIINCRVAELTSGISRDNKVVVHDEETNKDYYYSNMVKNADIREENGKEVYYGFALSWPYEFKYVDGFDGATHVNVEGGRIGLKNGESGYDDYGDVCGGGKGIAGDYQTYVFCANTGSSEVTIDYPSTIDPSTSTELGTADYITGAVYGGAENGHVMGNTKLTLKKGLIGHSIYGGGSGKGTFPKKLTMIAGVSNVTDVASNPVATPPVLDGNKYNANIYSITAGKVFGNTELIMEGGYVIRNVYGGGNMGSVGKGNYSGGSDDYSAVGYGELPPKNNQTLWTSSYDPDADNPTKDFPWHFLNSGKCTVTITGGTIGYIKDLNSIYPTDPNIGLPYGNVFGGCRGVSAPNIGESPRYLYSPEFFMGYVNETDVTIGKAGTPASGTVEGGDFVAATPASGPIIAGSVYGGGMDGHVRRDAKVTIIEGVIGSPYDGTKFNEDFWMKMGNVYGAGSGIGKYQYDFNYDGDYNDEMDYENPSTGRKSRVKETDFSTSAGSVTRFTKVEVKGGTIHRNVYGGGSLSTVGAPKIPPITIDPYRKGDTTEGHGEGKQTLNEVIISGGHIGDETSYDATTGNHVYGGMVYGGSRGSIDLGNSFSTANYTSMTITGSADIKGDVYGGGEAGTVKNDVEVNVTGGEVKHDVYGGGALADTNTSNWNATNNTWATGKTSASNKTTVNLAGGTIGGDAYGGGLGRLSATGVEPIEAKVYGDVLVELNRPTTSGGTTTYGNCVVKDKIFGCNNLNGSPQGDVTVHIYKTEGWTEGTGDNVVSHDVSAGKKDDTKPKGTGVYEVAAVYGGGNLAAYYPDDETTRGTAKANVIIDGCDLTSIQSVYGGGNAASTPATEVTVNGTYEIGEVFGGGNGKDPYQIDGKTYENPGANVGYKSYAYHVKVGETNYSADTHGSGTVADPYKAIEYTSSDGVDKDASTKANREAYYAYGLGKTQVSIYGGTVHAVYGGSNSKGNVREASVALLDGEAVDESDDAYCPFDVDEAYGGGKNADMDGTATLIVSCIQGLSEVYGGAKDADVNSDVNLTITNGTYGQVFGGNNIGGRISGSISVNIEETGCRPVVIGELYGGGNKACYSVYGYKDSGRTDEYGKTIWLPFESKDDAPVTVNGVAYSPLPEASKYGNPEVNVHSFTSIGTIYGGGLGTTATMVGSPTVNVNVYEGRYFEQYKGKDNVIGDNARVVGAKVVTNGTNGFPIPSHAKGAIGAINTIFGGGNAAEVIGNTTVNIGTETGEEVGEYMVVTVAANADVTGYYIYSPATYTQATGTAQAGKTYYQKTGDVYSEVSVEEGDDVEDYYTLNTAAGYYHPEGTAQNGVTYYQKKTVKGADIRGNVYGGGNNAKVTGNTNVVIGKESTTTP